MKKLFTLLAALFVVVAVQAQTDNFGKGDKVASLGIGFGSSYYGFPISLTYEQGIYDINDKSSIGVGGRFAYGAGTSAIVAAVTGSYHYAILDGEWDFSGEVALGYANVVRTFYFGISATARYYFTDHIAALAKVGYGLSWFDLGVSYKF